MTEEMRNDHGHEPATPPTRGDQAEAARLKEALIDARDNGLIYWEPRTDFGHTQRALMYKRINAALSPTSSAEPQAAAPVGEIDPKVLTDLASECRAAREDRANDIAHEIEADTGERVEHWPLTLEVNVGLVEQLLSRVAKRESDEAFLARCAIGDHDGPGGRRRKAAAPVGELRSGDVAVIQRALDATASGPQDDLRNERIMAALAAASVTGDRETAGVEEAWTELKSARAVAGWQNSTFGRTRVEMAIEAMEKSVAALAASPKAQGSGDHAAEPQAPDGHLSKENVMANKLQEALEGAFITTTSTGNPESSKRIGAFNVEFRGEDAAQRAEHLYDLLAALAQRPPGESKPEGEG